MKKLGSYITFAVFVLLIVFVGFLIFAGYLERGKPTFTLSDSITAVGRQTQTTIHFTDSKSGLSSIRVDIEQNGVVHTLAQEAIADRKTHERTIDLSIDAVALKLKNGPAVVRVTASDHAFFANRLEAEIPVEVDTIPPTISLLTPTNYVTPGGSCFIAFRTSKPVFKGGVYIQDTFTPAFVMDIQQVPTYVVFFAIPLDAAVSKTRTSLYVRDAAGNENRINLPVHIRDKKYRSDSMTLGQAFLERKMPEFQYALPELKDLSFEEVFAHVNSDMRQNNDETIRSITSKSVNRQLWEGAFLRMRNASTMAPFGDRRTYLINGKAVGTSVHLGVDLASVAHAPIEAANHGRVVFTQYLGIYGNTVIIDHGLGLMSLYSHLSSIGVSVGQEVQKGEQIGLSGVSGLAGGDHLHFSMIAGGQFVDPVEWWDPRWIEHNVIRKMGI